VDVSILSVTIDLIVTRHAHPIPSSRSMLSVRKLPTDGLSTTLYDVDFLLRRRPETLFILTRVYTVCPNLNRCLPTFLSEQGAV
jgi:hypothetical protein